MANSDYNIGVSLMCELEDKDKDAATYFDTKWRTLGLDGYVGHITAQGAMLRIIMSHITSIQSTIDQRVRELIHKYKTDNNLIDSSKPIHNHEVVVLHTHSNNHIHKEKEMVWAAAYD